MRCATTDRLALKLIRLLARAQAWVHWAAFNEPIWVSTDGTVYRYYELDDRHLSNIIKLLERSGEGHTTVYRRLRDEWKRRRRVQR